jgi:hypothetical protein
MTRVCGPRPHGDDPSSFHSHGLADGEGRIHGDDFAVVQDEVAAGGQEERMNGEKENNNSRHDTMILRLWL